MCIHQCRQEKNNKPKKSGNKRENDHENEASAPYNDLNEFEENEPESVNFEPSAPLEDYNQDEKPVVDETRNSTPKTSQKEAAKKPIKKEKTDLVLFL